MARIVKRIPTRDRVLSGIGAWAIFTGLMSGFFLAAGASTWPGVVLEVIGIEAFLAAVVGMVMLGVTLLLRAVDP